MKFAHLRDGFTKISSNMYAPNNKVVRRKFWNLLANFRYLHMEEKWIVIGDFNTPLSQAEKFGGSQVSLDSI